MKSVRFVVFLFGALLAASFVLAHETQTVGEGDSQYRVIVGLLNEPVFTGLRTGLDLRVANAAGDPVENLEQSLSVTLVSADGSSSRELTLRPAWGDPGSYVDDFILLEPGVYTLEFSGFIGSQVVDLSFSTHEVTQAADIEFP